MEAFVGKSPVNGPYFLLPCLVTGEYPMAIERSYGRSSFSMVKYVKSTVDGHVQSYVKLPEGTQRYHMFHLNSCDISGRLEHVYFVQLTHIVQRG